MQGPDADAVSWLRFAFASTTVIGLMALLGWALKYFGQKGWITPRGGAGAITVLSSCALDARRRLVIARCADKEYHLLLGPAGDLLLAQQEASPPPSPSSPDTTKAAP